MCGIRLIDMIYSHGLSLTRERAVSPSAFFLDYAAQGSAEPREICLFWIPAQVCANSKYKGSSH